MRIAARDARLRRSLRWLMLALALAAAPLSATALDDYIRLQTGSFTTAQQAKLDARYGTAIWHIAEIWPAGSQNVRWIYSESWLKDAQAPYMQRVSRVELQQDGSLVARRYAITQPERVVGAWQTPSKFAALTSADRVAMPGCEVVLTRAGAERFEGGTVGSRCANSYKGSAYAISQGSITAQGMTNWDRGFAASGAQTWGPVYGGYYEAISPAIDVFEGSPPPGRGVIIARFPCLEAAQRFWNSPEYAEIRKLREGLATFEVLVMPATQKPEYLAE